MLVQEVLHENDIHISYTRAETIAKQLLMHLETLLANGADVDLGFVTLRTYNKITKCNIPKEDIQRKSRTQTRAVSAKPSSRLRRRLNGEHDTKDKALIHKFYADAGDNLK